LPGASEPHFTAAGKRSGRQLGPGMRVLFYSAEEITTRVSRRPMWKRPNRPFELDYRPEIAWQMPIHSLGKAAH